MLALAIAPAGAKKIEVSSYRVAGPVKVKAPVQMDATDVNGKTYDVSVLLNAAADLSAVEKGVECSGVLPASDGLSMGLAGFMVQNSRYLKGTIALDAAPEKRLLYIDGKKVEEGLVALEPGSHKVVVKYLSEGPAGDLRISIDVPEKVEDYVAVRDIAAKDGGLYTVTDLLDSRRFGGVSLSPDGKYMIVNTYQRAPGSNKYFSKIVECATGNVLSEGRQAQWMPKSNRYWYTRKGAAGNELVTVDPATGKENVLAGSLPDAHFEISPSEDKLFFFITSEGPKEKKEIYETLTPDDRQPGWRNRVGLAVYDLATGVMQPLTFGYNNAYLSDISMDGKKILVQKTEARLTARPTTLSSLYMMDLDTFQTDTLVNRDGFLQGASFAPDGKKILLQATPEAFDWVGANVDEGQTPSMADGQLYLMDIASKEIKPLTKDFNPNVARVDWNSDGMVYFTAENKDSLSFYRMDPLKGTITMLDLPEEMISGFSVASAAPVLAFYGQGAKNSDRLYMTDLKTFGTKKQKITLVEDLSAKSLEGITVGDCISWSCQNSLGEDVLCRYYLPVDFDASKKYPMIVYYYGGCSPSGRNFESNYPQQTWSALGYVTLVVQPSGAAGFGQKWSARHVNTAGVDPARDIIESAKAFMASHDFVNPAKVGCVGASYGGFMTMYLQTVTDIFACAISHAGISDHTGYWGYGYWGYSYSETSMANSYPWTRKDLYVDRSPLYNADKVHTPLLFLHGTDDMNVPYNESIQMYTALKLLGRETALVSVDGQEHHINDYMKHIWWHNTQMAWFAKYLQDDDTWWEALYPHKDL